MKIIELKSKNKDSNYSILVGKNVLRFLPKKIKDLCPKTKKIAVIIDKNVPKKFEKNIRKILNHYQIYFYKFNSTEKFKSLVSVNNLLEKLILNKFNRSDLILAVGGGIVGDTSGFIASILKRGVNFINIPTTLLAQVDSSIGGKTGVNSKHGKNLLGSFYQPKLVISDVEFLSSLSKREMVCGYAEILKHSIIHDHIFFKWLKKNTASLIVNRNLNTLIIAIKKSCNIKLHFVNKDIHEKNLRMKLNFGHTFAHAIEAKSNYSKKINHGEAVLIGMMLATKFSYLKKICSKSTLEELKNIYEKNKLNYKLEKIFSLKEAKNIIYFMQNDKKNNDDKINFILLKKIGKTTEPGKYKISFKNLQSDIKKII